MPPRKRSAAILIGSVACACLGCGPSPIQGPTVQPPHRGVILKLPDDLGYAELVVESAGSSKPGRAELAAYFLGPDAKTALAIPVSGVTVEIYIAEAKTRKAVPMALQPRPADPSAGARFASPIPEGFDGNIAGPRITASVAGRSIEAP